ncbi:hypothetical protein ANCCAN_17601 [Ancylostoma caninum]|uniref:Uncharacterized protein n=1 Tax=Ancylostoma caninum TaxID=29170 RepID=A0A368FWL8_ANCCA|nr:hypothetical protein ANCCAN_17601 [Ancylostoma caninum]
MNRLLVFLAMFAVVNIAVGQLYLSTCARMDVPILDKAARAACITSCSVQAPMSQLYISSKMKLWNGLLREQRRKENMCVLAMRQRWKRTSRGFDKEERKINVEFLDKRVAKSPMSLNLFLSLKTTNAAQFRLAECCGCTSAAHAKLLKGFRFQNCGTGYCQNRRERKTCVCYRRDKGGNFPLEALIKRGK